jgi:23S rRNA (uracil1939-C5)-methyltransferase
VLQHLKPDAQIHVKQNVLRENLSRIGKVQPEQWLEPLVAGHWGYRRRARLSVKWVHKKDRALVGFRERGGRFVADLRRCHVLIPEIGDGLEQLSELIGAMQARTEIPQIELAAGDDRVVLVFRHLVPLDDADRGLLIEFARRTGFTVCLQSKGPDTIVPLEGSEELSFSVPAEELTFSFGPTHFVQVNAPLNQAMIQRAIDKLALQPDHRVLDLFCGLGNFTLPIARRCHTAIGVEGDQALVELGRSNAEANGITNAEFHCADLTEDHRGSTWLGQGIDRVLLDPPRSGAKEIIEPLVALEPARIVYISCHPGSLARDAGILVNEHGYRLLEAGVMDMFPHTAHVESIAVFEKG